MKHLDYCLPVSVRERCPAGAKTGSYRVRCLFPVCFPACCRREPDADSARRQSRSDRCVCGDGVAAREILFVAENSAGIAVIQNYPGLFWREAEPDELFQGCRVGIESEKRVAPGFPAFAGLGRFAG